MNNQRRWCKAILISFFCALALNFVAPRPARAASNTAQSVSVLPSILQFGHLTIDDGLVDNTVVAILQDSRGFMWFGTPNGLSRYDGYRFTTYQHDDDQPNSLSQNNIHRLLEDKDHMIWIATEGGGVDRFDPRTETFTHYQPDPNNPNGFREDRVYSIYQDSKGILWFGGSPRTGLNRFDPQTQTFTNYPPDQTKPDALHGGATWDILETTPGTLWLLGDNTINKFDVGTQRFSEYTVPIPNERHLTRLYQDSMGTLWAVGQRGLYKFDATQGKFTGYPMPAQTSDILEDENGAFWIAESSGLVRLDGQTGQVVQQYHHEFYQLESLSSSNIQSLYRDRSGVIWIGTSGGVNIYDPHQAHFVNYQHDPALPSSLSEGRVNAVYASDQTHLWVGIGSILNRLNLTTGEVEQFTSDVLREQSARITSIIQDHTGIVWLGMSNLQLLKFDPKTSQFKDYPFKSLAPPNPPTPPKGIVDLHEDKDGALWIAVNHDGLYQLDADRQNIKFFQSPTVGKANPDVPNPGFAPRPPINSISADHAGNLWLSTLNGMKRLNPQTGDFQQYRTKEEPSGPDSWFNAAHEDQHGNMWLASRDGLFRLNAETGAFQQYTQKDGLPSNNVIGISEDRSGNLWLGTPKGLTKFTPSTETFRSYDKSDGMQQALPNAQSLTITASGQMVFGGANGLTIFDPDKIADNPYHPPVVLTYFELFNKPVAFGKDSPLTRPIWATDSLTLDYDKNILSFEFAALNYASPQKNQYRYKLDGFEKDWNQADSSRRFVTYTNLPAGNYTFRVQGSNNNGIWSDQEATLKLTILPPWWETVWFRVAFALLIIAGLWAAVRWRLYAIEQRNRNLEKVVAERTQTLQSREEQLRHARDAAEAANRAKSAFLANMSHEFRTPLNVILGFTQVTHRNQAISNDVKENLDIIQRSGEHLLTLVNQVLDFSKIEAGHMTLNNSNFDLYQMLDELEAMFVLKAEDKHLKLRFESSDDLPRYVRADEVKLRQVLMNLINNALKFTEEGSVTVRANRPKDGAQVSFEIEDTGPGIAADELNTVFEAFTQTSAGREVREGTGLGLPISRRFVQLMGGNITLDSQVGQGTTVRFNIRCETVSAAEVQSTRDQRRIIALEAGQPRYRILVVDDNWANRQLLIKTLEPLGFDLREATNGKEATEIAPVFKPHLVFLDMRMPVMDGYETARRLKPAHPSTVIIALTASAFEEDRDAVLSAGCDDFMRKPFRTESLLEKLNERLGVRYIYAHDENQTMVRLPSDPAQLEALKADLSDLPADLLTRLTEGIELGDVETIKETIGDIRRRNASLADSLAQLAYQFEYGKLLSLIREPN